MDEFFSFEDAGNATTALDASQKDLFARHASSSTYDIEVILAQAASDGDFNSLQNFDIDLPPIVHPYPLNPVADTRMGEAHDFNDCSRRINGTERPPQPCVHCRDHKLECLLIPTSGLWYKGVCTSCTALSRPCIFAFDKTVHNPDFKPSSFQPYTTADVNHTRQNSTFTGHDTYRPSSFIANQDVLDEASSLRTGTKDDWSETSGRSGARFSRETVRLLKNWLSLHHIHPYPTEEEKEDLKRKTGLTKTQIANWLANARRRGQVRASRGTSPSTHNLSKPINIRKQSTPAFANMDPMERWKISPPENEPASVMDIAKAVITSTGISSNETSLYSYPPSEDGSVQSATRASSASSRATSHSDGASFGSAVSRRSRGSLGSFSKRGRRRRRPAAKATIKPTNAAPRQYQCTFCVESFKTKHDWQRHEKSLHLSLERWVCAPNISKIIGTAHKCAFCGLRNPHGAHYEKHNHAVCQERSLEERTFYRKDHLRQHLRLVHDCQFLASTMESWKVPAPEVRSRCGFCGLNMDSWAARVDHLAEHFKAGKSMADWKGSWGFEPQVQKLVENGIPPYLIYRKRMAAMSGDVPTERRKMTLYDQVKTRLLEFANEQAILGHDLTDGVLRAEASRAMAVYKKTLDPTNLISSWFCDLMVCPEDTRWQQDLRKKAAVRYRLQKQPTNPAKKVLDVNDKAGVEEYCEFERLLTDFVKDQRSLGLTPTDAELKAAGCRIVMEYDMMHSEVQSATAASWFCQEIMGSHSWTARFRERVRLPPSSETADGEIGWKEIDPSNHNYQTLDAELAKFVHTQAGLGVIPSDSDLQRQARFIIFEVDDPFLQTAADDPLWLANFKCMHGLTNIDGPIGSVIHESREESPGAMTRAGSTIQAHENSVTDSFQQPVKPRSLYDLRDAKCYRRLELELSRFVASCMSQHSPNPHIPSDEEIRRQARWIIYNDDNPWNQTAVDNAEWLLRFKRSHGLAPPEEGSGMRKTLEGVEMQFAGSSNLASDDMVISLVHNDALRTDWTKPSPQGSSNTFQPTDDSALSNHHIIQPTPHCSWNLESALAEYAQPCLDQGFIPSDDQLHAHADTDPKDYPRINNSASPNYRTRNASAAAAREKLATPRAGHIRAPALHDRNQNYHGMIDPQLWGTKRFLAGLEGMEGQL